MSKAVLLDTHIYLWLRTDSARLTQDERAHIDQAVIRYVSAVSLWEIALLMGLGRIDDDARLFTLPHGIDLLLVTPAHCQAVLALPAIHRDPFDRMLIAQSRVDNLALLTRDGKILSYGAIAGDP
ncbi:MAG: type II toxin-antitoxin system VapC family toxin [Azospirillaceae bacterium]|nr:type II toxin-antitoxin system VapC family toxin [Azospirillaceae bacterium]